MKNDLKQLIYQYCVIFDGKNIDKEHKPIIQQVEVPGAERYHLWDTDLNGIIPAIWYIMHLPRMALDVIEINIEVVLQSHDEPHNIILMPYEEEAMNNIMFMSILGQSKLVICEDHIYDKIRSLTNEDLIICRCSELSTKTLIKHWHMLAKASLCVFSGSVECIVDDTFRLTKPEERSILPLLQLCNQFGLTKQLIDNCSSLKNEKASNEYMTSLKKKIVHIDAELKAKDDEYRKNSGNTIVENPCYSGHPIVITMPGISGTHKRNYGCVDDIPAIEKEVILALGIHRAIAKNALYINVDTAFPELFTELDKIEDHCKIATRYSNEFVWKTLRRIGKLLNNRLKQHDLKYICTSSQITVFSDFPIGLAILDGSTAPLCCAVPISYRPLTPLTRAVQFEMHKQEQVYLGNNLKIIVAECIDSTDAIRPYCDMLTSMLHEQATKCADISLFNRDIGSINEFKSFLSDHKDADILIVSAHGHYNKTTRMAGLVIGNDIWMADDDDFRPPSVVLLSSCHVSPRGRGAVTVGDLFLRSGAIAVLGTFIPVDVRRNTLLIVRLIANIIAVRSGWSNMRTLDQVWHHTTSTNAFHEIIANDSSKFSKMEQWAFTTNRDGKIPQNEFKLVESVGRLRGKHIYRDTQRILEEMAEKDGMGDYFRSVMDSQGYFPESVFYQFLGYPENIFIRNRVFEKMHEMLMK